jgi:glycerol kinase
MTRILAIDQGTTNTKAVLFDGDLNVVDRASVALASHYPADGWAEQSAEDIRDSVRDAIADIAGRHPGDIDALAIANQRETLVAWDAQTGRPLGPAILWQCRRTAADCAALEAAGHGPAVEAATGLGLNPLFPASKLGWVMRNWPEAAVLAEQGRLRAGTVDAWLVWTLTGGASFATDHSNASRTQLFDTASLRFSPDLCALFGAPPAALPEPRASDAAFGATAAGATALPAGVPILAVMGDSHAALYGHGIRAPGEVKATFGTGSSLMALTPGRIASKHGLSGTIGWTEGGRTRHAIEGNITVSAQAAAFVAQMLGLADAAALSALAQTVPDAAGVSFVPALAGLGAPHWDDAARGVVAGLSLGSTPAHLARATFEAIAHQVADVFEAMEQDVGGRLGALRADGGASGNDFLMQLQADLLGRPVIRSGIAEIGARGAAAMALGRLGRDAPPAAGEAREFAPTLPDDARESARTAWRRAVDLARQRQAGAA